MRQAGPELEVGRAELNLHRHIVHDGDRIDRRQDEAQVAEPQLFVPIERNFHIFGIQRRSVMEHDAIAQRQGVSQRVGGDLPAGGQARHNLALARILRQAFVHGVDDIAFGLRDAHGGRVKRVGLAAAAQDEGSRPGHIGAGRRQHQQQRANHSKSLQKCLHVFVLST